MENETETPTQEDVLTMDTQVTPELKKVTETKARIESQAPNEPRSHTTMYCKDCGSQISSKAEICPMCGVRQRGEFGRRQNEEFSKNTKFCSECGSEINAKAELCPKCGTMQSVTSRNSSSSPIIGKNPMTAALLTFLIFIVGYLYIGRLKRGVVVMIISIVITAVTGGIGYLVMMPLAMYDTYKLASNEPAPYDILNKWDLG
jgi:RNA polymerase subunit RPABC4/transcription elongation factor Spt4